MYIHDYLVYLHADNSQWKQLVFDVCLCIQSNTDVRCVLRNESLYFYFFYLWNHTLDHIVKQLSTHTTINQKLVESIFQTEIEFNLENF